jgi:aldehyde dehydrogenase
VSLDILKSMGVTIAYKAQYNNFIGGKWVAPVKGEYFDVISPITGKNYTKAARSSAEDIELAPITNCYVLFTSSIYLVRG